MALTADNITNVVNAARECLRRDPSDQLHRGRDSCLSGDCYTLSEAVFHLLDGKNGGWLPHVVQHEGGPHWYLKHKFSGAIVDPTASQLDTPVPYKNGVSKGFLTAYPSKRAKVVMDRVATGGLGLAKAIIGNVKPQFQAAFRHLISGKVVPSGPVHDTSVLPDGDDDISWQAGFVDQHGKYHTRWQAAHAIGVKGHLEADSYQNGYEDPTLEDLNMERGPRKQFARGYDEAEPKGVGKVQPILKTESSTRFSVSSVAVFNSEGYLLMGLRNDSGKWTLPGGKSDPGEQPEACARRELWEEAGLKIKRLSFMGKGAGGRAGDIAIYSYTAETDDKPSSENDPDKEVDEWEWIDVRAGLPDDVARNLHNADRDVTLQLLGLQKATGVDMELSKSIKHALLGAIAAAGMTGTPAHAAKPPQGNQHVVAPHKWTPDGLAEGLKPIAFLESSNGKNTKHAPNSKGDYYSAYGAVGFKADTAHETYKKSKFLQKTFPGLQDSKKFLDAFKTNFALYNHVASEHWNHLRDVFGGDRVKAAYAWRWGTHAVHRDPPEVRENDPYVIAYKKLWAKQSGQLYAQSLKNPLAKAEDWLAKAQARVFRGKDGITIPATGTPARAAYDQRYLQALQDTFGTGVGKTLKPLRVPLDQIASGTNAAVNKDRLGLYQRMAQKDRLPPVVVRREGRAFHMMDGNHREAAARAAGLPDMEAYEVTDDKPSLTNTALPKGLKLYNVGEDPHGLMEPKVRQTQYGQFIEPVEFKDVQNKLKRMGFHGYHGHSRDPNAFVTFQGVKAPTVPSPGKNGRKT